MACDFMLISSVSTKLAKKPVPDFPHSIQTGTPVRYNCGIYKMSLLLLAVISWRSKPH